VRSYNGRVQNKNLKFYFAGNPPKQVAETLQKVPFVDPDIEQERERIIGELNDPIRITLVQIGIFYSVPHPQSRGFSAEWEHDCETNDVAWLRAHYDHKVIRITVFSFLLTMECV
jgi:RNA-dependent RNA polymerase